MRGAETSTIAITGATGQLRRLVAAAIAVFIAVMRFGPESF